MIRTTSTQKPHDAKAIAPGASTPAVEAAKRPQSVDGGRRADDAAIIHLSRRWTLLYKASGGAHVGGPLQDPQVKELLRDASALDIEQAADTLIGQLRTLGLAAAELTLALDASWLFAADVEFADLPRGSRRRRAMLYRLEQRLPLDAEDLAADFVAPAADSPSKKAALGVAVETRRLQSLVERLEQAGASVGAIIPADLAVLAAVREAAERKTLTACDYLLLGGGKSENAAESRAHNDYGCGEFSVFALNGAAPVRWFTARDPADLRRVLRSDLLHHPPQSSAPRCLTAVGITGKILDALHDEGIECLDGPPGDDAYETLLVRGASIGACDVNLRRDALATRKPWSRLGGHLRWTAALLCVLWLALAGSFIWRGMGYERLRAGSVRQLRSEFTRRYPGSLPPAAPITRLESELKAMGAAPNSSDTVHQAANVLAAPFALDALRDLFENLPTELRLRVNELRISEGQILLEGELRSHADAEGLRAALSRGAATMDSPRTERLDRQRVGFTMTGRVAGSPSASGEAQP